MQMTMCLSVWWTPEEVMMRKDKSGRRVLYSRHIRQDHTPRQWTKAEGKEGSAMAYREHQITDTGGIEVHPSSIAA